MNSVGQLPGILEILYTSRTAAINFAVEQAATHERDLNDWPFFGYGYEQAREMTQRCGYLLRKEMPVVDEVDLPAFKEALTKVDIRSFCDVCQVGLEWISPIQKQIYVDKSVGSTIKAGRKETEDFIKSQHVVISNEGMLIDGHHRWLSGMVCDTKMVVPAFRSRIPLAELFPIVMAFSRAQGNQANG